MRKTVTILAATMCLATAMAQNDVVEDEFLEEEEPIRRYTVEVIVFSYEENVSIGSEIFLPDASPAEEEIPIDADQEFVVDFEEIGEIDGEVEEPPAWSVDTGEEYGESDEENPMPLRFVLLGEDELTLGDEIRQFELLDAYATIMHVGWTQPTYPEEQSPSIGLHLLGEVPEGLDGSFTLYLSRYLHLVVDLALNAPDEFDVAVVDDEPDYDFSDYRPRYDPDIELAPQPVKFRIQENRIVKNGELRYFDHPKFGVLARITRFEEEEEVQLDPLVLSTGE